MKNKENLTTKLTDAAASQAESTPNGERGERSVERMVRRLESNSGPDTYVIGDSYLCCTNDREKMLRVMSFLLK